jgi:predicted transposase/invertase (TIGR01784 family)
MYQTKIINPHAMFFEKVFSRTDVVTDFLQNYLPEKVVSQLDLSTIKLEKKTFVSNELKSTQSDLLFRVKTNDDLFLRIYILLEHKSYLDRWVMLQLLGYIVQIFENQRQVNKQKRQEIRDANIKQNQPENAGIKVEYLEPVIPIVIYHGKSDWNVQNDLSSLFNKGIIYQKYIPDFQFELVNTANFDDDDFRGNVILHVALMAMKHYFMDDLEEKTPELLRLLRDLIINKNSGIVFLEVLLRYLSTNKNYDKEWLKSLKKSLQKKENI